MRRTHIRLLGKRSLQEREFTYLAPQLIALLADDYRLHGAHSVISMQGAEAIAARIPRARVVALKDVGHFPYVAAPLGFSAAVRTFVRP